ncbi:hypothetical protein LOK49_LG15G01456 [Camellia lanceoleosa]|uniref:Uncharacterized protein n=1 Tax=Camellia lanceoleosa TaxID=1840588 RepID=A0ACC0F3X5_9ERIC|nr:hypothetical protein LOK49_LG15G01456 [Camellia lanceoleosa]
MNTKQSSWVIWAWIHPQNSFQSTKSSARASPWKSPQLEFVEVRNCHCCCRLLHLNPIAVYRLLLSWANAELPSQGVATKWQNSTSFGSAETKNNKCTTRQQALYFNALSRWLDNLALTKSATDAMNESHVLEFLTSVCALIVMVDVQSTIVFSMVF